MMARLCALMLNPNLDAVAVEHLSAQMVEQQERLLAEATTGLESLYEQIRHLPPIEQAKYMTQYMTSVLQLVAL